MTLDINKDLLGGIEADYTCDDCGYSQSFDGDSFEEAKQLSKEEGRRSKMVNGSRQNYCPECVENFSNQNNY